jgi:hypothetical protein
MTTTAEDSDLLRAVVRGALSQLSSSADVRRAMATARGFEDPVWDRLARELGLPGRGWHSPRPRPSAWGPATPRAR